jgi:hypothetical protein
MQQLHDIELKTLESSLSSARLKISPLEIKPQKSDIDVGEVSLAWLPWRVKESGFAEPVYSRTDSQ